MLRGEKLGNLIEMLSSNIIQYDIYYEKFKNCFLFIDDIQRF